MSTRVLLLCSTGLALSAVSAPALAQDSETGGERQTSVSRVLDTVTVSATKKANVENVQNVPVAVTAFNSDTLEALKVRDLESLSYSAPNVALDDIGTSRGTANFSIRGLGINSSIPSIDPAVGVFVDGVYLGVNNGVVFDLFDLDSVEVLRGPQGLLFGRNTTGGAVLVNTGNPTDELEWKVRAAVEGPVDDDRGGPNSIIQGVVSGPLVEGVLNGKLGAYYNTDSGYFENKFNGDNQGEAQTSIVRGALEWFATEDVTFLAKGEVFQSRGDGPPAQNRAVYERGTFDLAVDNPGELDNETIFASLRTDIDVDFGNGTITNILGYRDYEATTDGDIDALPLFLFHSDTQLEQDQISNELRYAGTFGPADVTTGLYYFDQTVAYDELRFLPSVTSLTFAGGGRQDHSVAGIFGQVDYAFTDKLTGILGLRYAEEEKDAEVSFIIPRAQPCSIVDGTCPVSGTDGFTDSEEWSNWTPKVGFQYFATDTTQVYGNYTKGFRSGGYNFRITDPATFLARIEAGDDFAFDEEEVDSYEIGVKHETQDGRGQLNSAVFFTQISDMQREVNLASEGAGVSQFIQNTADADIFGVELEGRYALSDSFLLTANVGLIDAEYTEVRFDISGDGIVDGADEALSLPRVPESTYGFGAIYDVDLGRNGAIVSRFNYQYRDRFAYTDNNLGWISEIDRLDANIAWETPVQGMTLSLYGKNLLDESIAGGDTQVPFGGSLAPSVPDGQNLTSGEAVPFSSNPQAGTFSPLKKGRVIGIELTIER